MIVGICGYKGAGKSTVCETGINLERSIRKPYIRFGFSDPIYSMLIAMGVPEYMVINKAYWNDPLEILCGNTIRFAATTLGTQWGRECLGELIWSNLGIIKANIYINQGKFPIIDNVRFISEGNHVIESGGVLIAFHRPGLEPDLTHESEQEIEFIQNHLCKYQFVNSADLQTSALEFKKLLDLIQIGT